MENSIYITITSIVAIMLLECVNMIVYGTDGTILLTVIAVVAGLAGYSVGDMIKKR